MRETQRQTSARIPISSSTWLITGVGRGLGRSIAEEVLRRGGKVAGTVRNVAQADQLKEQFRDRLWIGQLDLSDFTNIAEVFRAAVGRFGRVHAVVSNAAYSLLGAAEELELDAIRRIVDSNLIGSIELARAAVAHMRPLGGGRLLQISSGAGQAGFPGLSLYCATKWGIEGFFEALAPRGFRLRHPDDSCRAWNHPNGLRRLGRPQPGPERLSRRPRRRIAEDGCGGLPCPRRSAENGEGDRRYF